MIDPSKQYNIWNYMNFEVEDLCANFDYKYLIEKVHNFLLLLIHNNCCLWIYSMWNYYGDTEQVKP